MSTVRERLIAAAALTLSVLVMATSVEIGRAALAALFTAVVTYGTAVLAAALTFALLGRPVGVRQVITATRTVAAAAVVIGLVLYAIGRSLWGVIG
ncbi:hypothetical protein [Streptomyces sp. LN325]|uniref:hypothetical protein n=1 Tax=Streptomyces sp. LN325 TaxID=3112976 RepID=UPI00371FBAD9